MSSGIRVTRPPESLSPPAPLDIEIETAFSQLTASESEFLRKTISPDDRVWKQALVDIQKEAYAKYPYPCIRLFHFVKLYMHTAYDYDETRSVYEKILQDNRASQAKDVFLDLGCCLGSDARKLADDGYPSSQIVACDLRSDFLRLGHKLFGDEATSAIKYLADDIFNVDLESSPRENHHDAELSEIQSLQDIRGRVRYIFTGSLFHLFDEETQLALAIRLLLLLDLESDKECIVFGRHQGMEEKQNLDDWPGVTRLIHSPESYEELWRTAAEKAAQLVFSETARRALGSINVRARLAESFPSVVNNKPLTVLRFTVRIGGE